jgi:hypothetical protein
MRTNKNVPPRTKDGNPVEERMQNTYRHFSGLAKVVNTTLKHCTELSSLSQMIKKLKGRPTSRTKGKKGENHSALGRRQ